MNWGFGFWVNHSLWLTSTWHGFIPLIVWIFGLFLSSRPLIIGDNYLDISSPCPVGWVAKGTAFWLYPAVVRFLRLNLYLNVRRKQIKEVIEGICPCPHKFENNCAKLSWSQYLCSMWGSKIKANMTESQNRSCMPLDRSSIKNDDVNYEYLRTADWSNSLMVSILHKKISGLHLASFMKQFLHHVHFL